MLIPALEDIAPKFVAQTVAEPVLPAKVGVVCEVDVGVDADPAGEEARPAVPSPVVRSAPTPRPVVPGPDVFGEEADAVPAVVPAEPFVALHGADVPVAAPIKPTVLPCATVELGVAGATIELDAAVEPRLSPPPSNVGSIAMFGLVAEHAVEFVSPK